MTRHNSMMLGSNPRKWGKQNVLARRGSMRGLGESPTVETIGQSTMLLPMDSLDTLKFSLWALFVAPIEDGCFKQAIANKEFTEYLYSLTTQLSKSIKEEKISADDAISIVIDQCSDVMADADKQLYKDARSDKQVSDEELAQFITNKKVLETNKAILMAELMAFAYFAVPNIQDAATQTQMSQALTPFKDFFTAVAGNLALAILADEITIETAKEEAKAQILDILETDAAKQKYAKQREDKTLSDEEWTAIKATLAKKSKEASGVSEESTKKTSKTKIAVMAGVGVVALLGMAMIIKKS